MKQVIHVHIPRTAGRSMMFWAKQHSHSFQHLYRSHNTQWNPAIQWTYFGHNTLDELIKNKGVLEEWWDSCFKFAFVRNTWSRLVSLYAFQKTRKFRRSGRHWTCKHLKDFPSFIDHLYFEPESIWPKYNHKQLARLRRPVDFIGRFEKIKDDWKKVCELAEMPYFPLAKHNYVTRDKPYTEYYTPRLRHMVEERYGEEIERFHFQFGE